MAPILGASWVMAPSLAFVLAGSPTCPLLFILFLCLFLSLCPFQLYFIPYILPTTLRFLTLFFQSQYWLISPFNYISLSKSLRTQKLKSHLVRTQSLNVLPLKPGVGQYIAIHAMLTARDFFFAYFYPSAPFTCIFPKPLPIFPVLVVANTWFLRRPAE